MNRKITARMRHVARLMAACAVVGLLSGAAWAGDIYVDAANCPGPGTGTIGDPFCLIQDAIDVASENDTIHVAAGTYDVVTQIDVNVAGLTITGAGEGVTIIDGSGKDASINNGGDLLFNVIANGVSIEEMTIDLGDDDADFDVGIFTPNASVDDFLVQNCTLLYADSGAPAGPGEQLIHLGSGSGHTVSECTFDVASANSVLYVGDGANDSLTVSNNEAAPVASVDGGAGDADGGGTFFNQMGPVTNSTISGNTLTDTGIAVYLGSGTTDTDTVAVTGNTFSSTSGFGSYGALVITSEVDGVDTKNIAVTNNLFAGTEAGGAITIFDSAIPGTPNVDGDSIDINNNSFMGDNTGGGVVVGLGVSGVVDATSNWWGAADGPADTPDAGETTDIGGDPDACGDPADDYNTGTGDGVVDTSTEVVDYCPWDGATLLELTADTDACYAEDDMLEVFVEVSNQPLPVNGVQFSVEYDTAVLLFVSAAVLPTPPAPPNWIPLLPGSVFFIVDDPNGTIDAAFSSFTGSIPGPDSSQLARFTFEVLAGEWCGEDLVRFRDLPLLGTKVSFENPYPPPFDEVPDQLNLASIGVNAFLTPPGIQFFGIGDYGVECPEDVTDGSEASATGCGDVDLSYSDSHSNPNGCPDDITRTWTATDVCGNTATATQTIHVEDITDPTIACPVGESVECFGDVPAAATTMAGFLALTNADADDNCTDPLDLELSHSDSQGGNTVERTYTVTDECGNEASCYQIITITDSTPPLIQCPTDVTVECDASTDPDGWHHKMHYPQLPDPGGWDIMATGQEIADDFMCTESGPLLDVHFWGSWKDDNVGQITTATLSIYADIPDPDGDGPMYSMPGALLWTMTEPPGPPGEEPVSDQGWFNPLTGEYEYPDHNLWYRYDMQIPQGAFDQVAGTIYWLSISVTVADPETEWGWKTTLSPWNDDGVFWDGDGWRELREVESYTPENGRFSESYAGGGPGQPDDVVHAASWDGSNLGGEWEIYGPTIDTNGAIEISNTVDVNGDGQIVYETNYEGGTLTVDSSLCCGCGGLTADIIAYRHDTTVTYVGGNVTSVVTVATAVAVGQGGGPGLYLRATATQEGEGDEMQLPADYPVFLPDDPYIGLGAWGIVENTTLSVTCGDSLDLAFIITDGGPVPQLGMAYAEDNCDGALPYMGANPPTGAGVWYSDVENLIGCDGTGTVTRTWTAVDVVGNSSSCVQTITVVDTTPPVVICPPDFEVECDQPTDQPSVVKWSQQPDPAGWDIDATSPNVVADDWRCDEDGFIDDIHFWGSWKDDVFGVVNGFHISIYADIPADQSPTGYSMPGALLWDFEAPESMPPPVDPPSLQGWYDPVTGEMLLDNHVAYFRYDIENITNPFYQEAGTIYWLGISATVAGPERWGWKTSTDHWNDDAVYLDGSGEWQELYGPAQIYRGEFFATSDGQVFQGGPGEWIEYPQTDPPGSSWWNTWFPNPYDPLEPKVVHLEFGLFAPGSFVAALNYSDVDWDDPNYPGPLDDARIVRIPIPASAFTDLGGDLYHVEFDYVISFCPAWLSMDVLIDPQQPDPFEVTGGTIAHACLGNLESLDMAFELTTIQWATATDTCDPDPAITYSDSFAPDPNCTYSGTLTRTWTATDGCGNPSSCDQIITIVDTTPPDITCPGPVTLDADVDCLAVVPNLAPVVMGTIGTGGATATTVAGGVQLQTSEGLDGSAYVRLDIPGGIALNAITSLSYTAKVTTSGAGGFAPEVVLNMDADGDGILEGTGIGWMHSFYNPATLGYVDATDRGDNFLSGDNWPPGAVTPDLTFVNRNALGAYNYWSADDERDALSLTLWHTWATLFGMLPLHDIDATDLVYSIDIVVGTSPNFDGMAAIIQSVELNGTTYSAALATDNCDTDVTITQSPEAGEVIGLGDTVVTLTAEDDCGNTTTCDAMVTVVDTTDPTITCPATVVVDTDAGVCEATGVDLGTPTTDDNCSVADVSNDAMEPFSLGDTTVTWTVTDGAGLTATCTQTVTVVDNEDPTIACPADIQEVTDTGQCYATITDLGGPPTTGDNCSVASVTNDAPGNDQYDVGDTIVTWTVTDGSGNTATCEQTITVTEDELPTITCPADVTDSTDPNECFATSVPLGTPTANDNCPGVFTYNDAPAQFPLGDTTVTWTAEDASGNTATCTHTVTVTDDEDPSITCPLDVYVQCPEDVPAAAADYDEFVLAGGEAPDNCSAVVSVVHIGDVTDSGSCPETITRTYRATDEVGNWAECVQYIWVDDTLAPTTLDCPEDIIVPPTDPGCNSANVSWTPPTWSDNCTDAGGLVMTNTHDPNDPFSVGTTTVTYTATDECGNTGTCEFDVTVVAGAYVDVTVQLTAGPIAAGPFTRCITFEIWECPAYRVVFDYPMTFTNGIASDVIGLLVCGDYECITARDKLHTLRSTGTVSLDPLTGYWLADFTGAAALIGGNATGYLNEPGDDCIDITDFSMLAFQFSTAVGADTDCSTAGPHTDFSGNGSVDLGDFSFIQSNFATCDQANCCGRGRGDGFGGPQYEISVKELEARGLGYLAVIDMDRDGWIDTKDVMRYIEQITDPETAPTVEPNAPGGVQSPVRHRP